MFKNYWTIAWRNTLKHKGYAFIKISGLALGIACCLLAYLHIKSELSYDDFHQSGDTTFRVIRVLFNKDDYRVRHRDPSLAPQMGSLLPSFFPEILSQTRYADFIPGIVTSGDQPFRETLHMADASFLEIFSFPLLAGNPATVLSTESNIVLTESSARKYFGTRHPLGERLTISYGEVRKDFIVSGIAADPPKISIFEFPSALVFQKQMRVLNEKDLGYRREGLLGVLTQDNGAASSRRLVALFRERVAQNPHITGLTASNAAFGLSPAPRRSDWPGPWLFSSCRTPCGNFFIGSKFPRLISSSAASLL